VSYKFIDKGTGKISQLIATFFLDEPQYTFTYTMTFEPVTRRLKTCALFCLLILCVTGGTHAQTDGSQSNPEPAFYLNFNEGSGNYALDASGNGNTGTIYGASRIESGGCGRAISLDGMNNYVEIPFTFQNHPTKAITVSLWFYPDSFEPQVLVSTYEEGGYRLGFDDGGDLWWTLNLDKQGEVSIPVQHEGIRLHQWHQVTGTYDGYSMKVYLDGVLRNQMNTTGAIHYEYNNYVALGADAGPYNRTDPGCPQNFHGGLDEVRIYPTALTYGQVMDDRFHCSQEPVELHREFIIQNPTTPSCYGASGSVKIGPNQVNSQILSFMNQTENGTWKVTLPPGSTLVVKAQDHYSLSYPDYWYIELSDENGRITRSVAFPNTNNAPVTGIVPSGNATVLVRYFDGKERFPAKVSVQFESITPPQPQMPPQSILNYPIIVIYSASWATLIAIIVVMIWLHRRKNRKLAMVKEP
jgi:hypothetical protein